MFASIVCLLVIRIFLSFDYMVICKTFLNVDFSLKRWLLGSAVCILWGLLDQLLAMKLHVPLLMAVYILLPRYVFALPWKKSWLASVTLLVFGEITEVLLLLLSNHLFSAEEQTAFNNTNLLSVPNLKLNFVGAMVLLALAGACLLVKKSRPKVTLRFLLYMPLWPRLLLTAGAITTLGIWYWHVADENIYGGSEGAVVLIVVFVLLFLLLLSIAHDIAESRLEKRNRALGATQQSIASFLNEMRSFRHDIANMLYGWQGAVNEGDPEKIKEYNFEMNAQFLLINNENALNLQKLTNGSMRALLAEKLKNAEQSGVSAHLLVEGVFEHFKMRTSDLCRVLGILTDNALRAANDCARPTVHIHIFREDDSVNFLVRNTAPDSLIESMSIENDTEQSEEDYTLEHGIGLKSARQIVARYSKTELSLYTRGRYVEACLTMNA